MCYGYCITVVGLGVCEKRNEWKKKRPARRIDGGTGCENFSFSVRAYTVTTRAKPSARAFGRDRTTTFTCTVPTTVVVPQIKVRDNACDHISRWPVGARRLSPPSAATKSARDGALGRGRTEAPARGLAGAYTGERRAPLLDARSSGDPRARDRHSMHGCTLCTEPPVPAPPSPPRPLHRIGSRRHASRVAPRI
jgi:hypothetical protein